MVYRHFADGFVRRLRSSAPVTWFAPLMGNSYDEDRVWQDFVDHGIRKAADQQPPKSAVAGCARLRRMMRTIEGPTNLDKECLTKTSPSCFVEPGCGRKLGLGKRMNLELAHSRLRRTRARASSAGTLATLPA
jgi:hypothetical protein